MKRFLKSSCARSKQALAKGGSKKEEENKTDNRAREGEGEEESFFCTFFGARGVVLGGRCFSRGGSVRVCMCVCAIRVLWFVMSGKFLIKFLF